MSVETLTAAIATIRAMIGDTGDHRESMVRDERLEGVDGANKRFTVLYYPIAMTTDVTPVPRFELRLDGALLTYSSSTTPPAGQYNVDPDTGIVTMGTAPTNGDPIQVLSATYRFVWYKDDAYHEWIVNAAITMGFGPSMSLATPALKASAALVAIPDGLLDALHKMVGHLFNKRRATEYAIRFASSSGGQSVQVDVVTGNFRKLADELWDEAIQMRDDYYKRRGGAAAPAAGISRFRPIPTYTPRR